MVLPFPVLQVRTHRQLGTTPVRRYGQPFGRHGYNRSVMTLSTKDYEPEGRYVIRRAWLLYLKRGSAPSLRRGRSLDRSRAITIPTRHFGRGRHRDAHHRDIDEN